MSKIGNFKPSEYIIAKMKTQINEIHNEGIDLNNKYEIINQSILRKH